jgi:hypothetical protein
MMRRTCPYPQLPSYLAWRNVLLAVSAVALGVATCNFAAKKLECLDQMHHSHRTRTLGSCWINLGGQPLAPSTYRCYSCHRCRSRSAQLPLWKIRCGGPVTARSRANRCCLMCQRVCHRVPPKAGSQLISVSRMRRTKGVDFDDFRFVVSVLNLDLLLARGSGSMIR